MAKSRRRPSRAPVSQPDIAGMGSAVRDFLQAAGIEVTGTDLEATPSRVARAWSTSLLDGYQADPAAILGETYPVPPGPKSTVLLKGIPFHGLCPHHLLPYHGLAHIAYIPKTKVASLSSLGRLVDAFSHRLEIQETLTRQIAEALVKHLGAEGVAVALETDQLCMTLRHPERRGTRTITRHFTGVFARRSEIRLEFLKSLESFA